MQTNKKIVASIGGEPTLCVCAVSEQEPPPPEGLKVFFAAIQTSTCANATHEFPPFSFCNSTLIGCIGKLYPHIHPLHHTRAVFLSGETRTVSVAAMPDHDVNVNDLATAATVQHCQKELLGHSSSQFERHIGIHVTI